MNPCIQGTCNMIAWIFLYSSFFGIQDEYNNPVEKQTTPAARTWPDIKTTSWDNTHPIRPDNFSNVILVTSGIGSYAEAVAQTFIIVANDYNHFWIATTNKNIKATTNVCLDNWPANHRTFVCLNMWCPRLESPPCARVFLKCRIWCHVAVTVQSLVRNQAQCFEYPSYGRNI